MYYDPEDILPRPPRMPGWAPPMPRPSPRPTPPRPPQQPPVELERDRWPRLVRYPRGESGWAPGKVVGQGGITAPGRMTTGPVATTPISNVPGLILPPRVGEPVPFPRMPTIGGDDTPIRITHPPVEGPGVPPVGPVGDVPPKGWAPGKVGNQNQQQAQQEDRRKDWEPGPTGPGALG